jgi:hypothetical protein
MMIDGDDASDGESSCFRHPAALLVDENAILPPVPVPSIADTEKATRGLLNNETLQKTKVRQALVCKTCNSLARKCEVASNYSPGLCLILHCPNKCSNWFFCVSCQKRINKKRVTNHFGCRSHLAAVDKTIEVTVKMDTEGVFGSNMNDNASSQLIVEQNVHYAIEQGNNNDDGNEPMDYVDGLSAEDIDTAMSSITAPTATIDSLSPSKQKKQDTLEWLRSAFIHVEEATDGEVMDSFGDQTNMKLYHFAEHQEDNGGIKYLVSRAFQRTEMVTGCTGSQVATQEEAQWHFLNFVQYMSMSEQQRKRQAKLAYLLAAETALNKSFFKATRILQFEELNRYYGRSNRHTIWNILPIPTIENIDGIAYVNPINICRFLIAFSTNLDDFLVEFGEEPLGNEDDSLHEKKGSVVFHIAESTYAQDWKRTVHNQFSQDEGHRVIHQFRKAILAWACDWRDGFGANRTKQQRKPTNAWTFTLSTPKTRINSIDNTMPIAVGLKKNKSWHKVEHRFREDMKKLANGMSPILCYHGGLRKVVPVFVKRMVSLTDKVERGDYTSTLSCTSKYHRCFGKIICFDAPKVKKSLIENHLDCERRGDKDLYLRQFGWSASFLERTNNGGRLPSCYHCRKANVDSLRHPDNLLPSEDSSRVQCEQCADWTLDSSTKEMLSFSPPKNYPTTTLPDCPVEPPIGRGINLQRMQYIQLDFDTIRQAVKFAFYNSCAKRGTGWNKEQCKAYLRVCGINGKQQDLIYAEARKAWTECVTVDYENSERLGGYQLPAAWDGDLPLQHFIETLMHLLFLGIAESNFLLCNKYLLNSPGRGVESFKKNTHELLKKLTRFNLSWLLVLPFSGGNKTKLTTGTWVSENWLAWVRISKIVYAWFAQNQEDERRGGNDVIRLVACFTALVSQILSHSGTTRQGIALIGCYLKEFLSCVRELDVRVRYKELHKASNKNSSSTNTREVREGTSSNALAEDKLGEQWWLKSNYISSLNLLEAMRILGPLINYWDGGGKGERYIQEIKPHIPRGVRDGGQFFVRLLKKIFKLVAMKLIELGCMQNDDNPLTISIESDSDDEDDDTLDNESSTNSDPPIDATVPMIININSESTDEEEDAALSKNDVEEQWCSPMEDEQMSKARTVYVYKKREILQEAVDNKDPIAGIIIKGINQSAELYAIFKRPGKKFGWTRICFDDRGGIQWCGLWYAPFTLKTAMTRPPKNLERIQNIAKMSAMAIPLRFALGKNHPDANKYCVITNWWRERNRQGIYGYPTLDFDRYEDRKQQPASNTNTI